MKRTVHEFRVEMKKSRKGENGSERRDVEWESIQKKGLNTIGDEVF